MDELDFSVAPVGHPADLTLPHWQAYHRTGDPALRDRLVLTLAPLVRHAVTSRPPGPGSDVGEMLARGLQALTAAVEAFDPAQGLTLPQYSWRCVHAAVRDARQLVAA